MYPNMNRVMQDLYYGVGPSNILQTGSTTKPPSSGSYWRGQDGNVWVAGDRGTNSAGAWDANTENYWTGKGYSLINDPRAGANTSTDQSQLSGNDYYAQQQANQQAAARAAEEARQRAAEEARQRAAEEARQRAEDTAYIDDQLGLLRGMYGDIDTRYNEGLRGVENAYNQESDAAKLNKAKAFRDYQVKEDDTLRGKDQAINRVDTYARTLAEGLRRRLGMASGSDSSAYQITAPGAVARDASGKRTGVLEDYGVNFRNLDLAKKDAEDQYAKLFEDLATQKRNKLMGLETGIEQQRQGLYQQEAELAGERARVNGANYAGIRTAQQPYRDRLNQSKTAISDIFNKYTPTYQRKAINVQTPSLRDYIVDKTKISGGGQAQDPYAPYTNYLRKPEDEEQKLTY